MTNFKSKSVAVAGSSSAKSVDKIASKTTADVLNDLRAELNALQEDFTKMMTLRLPKIGAIVRHLDACGVNLSEFNVSLLQAARDWCDGKVLPEMVGMFMTSVGGHVYKGYRGLTLENQKRVIKASTVEVWSPRSMKTLNLHHDELSSKNISLLIAPGGALRTISEQKVEAARIAAIRTPAAIEKTVFVPYLSAIYEQAQKNAVAQGMTISEWAIACLAETKFSEAPPASVKKAVRRMRDRAVKGYEPGAKIEM